MKWTINSVQDHGETQVGDGGRPTVHNTSLIQFLGAITSQEMEYIQEQVTHFYSLIHRVESIFVVKVLGLSDNPKMSGKVL